MKRWLALALAWLAVAAGALAWRLPELDRRPMHHDEAVNAILFQGLWERGDYRYNPDEYHGPALHYATLPLVRLSGAADFDRLSEGNLRLVAVLAGVGLVLLVPLLRDALGPAASLFAALLLAVSPAMVFYSRYFIHEMLLACFTLLLVGAAWRYGRTRAPGWAALAGAALGLLHATKETFVLTLAALGVAGAATWAWNRRSPDPNRTAGVPWSRGHAALALGVAVVVSLLLFTSFLTHPRGPVDSLLTYLPWLRRAGGHSPHLHPWYWYFERLLWFRALRGPLWTEAFVAVLALVGWGVALTGRGLGPASPGFARFLAVFTVAITTAYCAIPYKTPWCLVNFLLPMILLAGLGAAALVRWADRGPRRGVVGLFLGLGVAHLAWQSSPLARDLMVHRGHPYAYSQTVPNVLELAERVQALARLAPDGVGTEVKVIAPDSAYWPLPWYLRRLRNVWWLDALPADPYAPVMVVAASLQAALDEKSDKRYLSVGYYELRPREFFELYVEFGLWKRFVETMPRPPEEE